MSETLPTKRPAEVLDYRIDASDLLGEGETVVAGTSSVTVTGATKDSNSFDNTGVTVWLSGGTAGTLIKISASLKTSGGRTFQRFYVIPYGEPVTLEQAKAQVGLIDDDSRDELIVQKIRAAREMIEERTGHYLVRRTVDREPHHAFGSYIELYTWPVISIEEVSYNDISGVPQVYAEGHYRLDPRPARIYPAYSGSWPSLGIYGGVNVTYTAGWAEGEVPQRAVEAILVLLSGMFSEREGAYERSVKAAYDNVSDMCLPGLG